MNEKQIEIAIRKLRLLWVQNKTQIGRKRIEQIAATLKRGFRTPLIPLTYCNTDTVKQGNILFDIQGKPYGMTYADWLAIKA